MNKKPHYDWQFQRLSALFLVFSLPILLTIFSPFKENSYVQIVAKLKQPWVPIFLSLVMVMLVFHTLLGVKAIVRDYLQEKWANYVLITMQIVTVSLMAISLLSLTNIVMEP